MQSDGKVLVGGQFTAVNGVTRSRVARLNADGTLDTGFLNGFSGPDNAVYSVAAQSDGKVFIGGGFETVNGVNRTFVARLNADGGLDGGFLTGLSGNADGVRSVAVQSDGKVLVGGLFTAVNGVSRTNIARLNADGSLDSGFLNGLSGANDAVYSVAVQSDGKVLIGGNFTAVNGVGRTNIARLNPDGAMDSGFLSGLSGADSDVWSVAVQTDGRVLIGGFFNMVNGVPAAHFARLWGSADIPPQIKSINRSGGDVSLSWYVISNRTYRVQHTGDLSTNNWADLPGDISASDATAGKTDADPGGASQRFYRVLLLP